MPELLSGLVEFLNSSDEPTRFVQAIPVPWAVDAAALVSGTVTITASSTKGPFAIRSLEGIPAWRIVSTRVPSFYAFWAVKMSGSAAGSAKTWGGISVPPGGVPADGELFVIAELELDPGTLAKVEWSATIKPAT